MILELLRIMEEPKQKHEKPGEIKKCPDCGGEIVNENGERYCKKCGLVID